MNWTEILDSLVHEVDAAEAALDNDEPISVDLSILPTDVEPLPAELRERAINVLRRQSEIQQRIENLKETIARELGDATRATRAASAFGDETTPSYIDSKV